MAEIDAKPRRNSAVLIAIAGGVVFTVAAGFAIGMRSYVLFGLALVGAVILIFMLHRKYGKKESDEFTEEDLEKYPELAARNARLKEIALKLEPKLQEYQASILQTRVGNLIDHHRNLLFISLDMENTFTDGTVDGIRHDLGELKRLNNGRDPLIQRRLELMESRLQGIMAAKKRLGRIYIILDTIETLVNHVYELTVKDFDKDSIMSAIDDTLADIHSINEMHKMTAKSED